MADLQELFARLNNGQGAGGAQSHGYHHASVSSPVYSPSPSGPQPHHQSAVMSPNTSMANTPAPEQAPQQTPQQQSAQLLNLLRFNSQPSVAQARRPSHNALPPEPVAHGRVVSASDLVASFMGGKSTQPPASLSPAPAPAARVEPASVPSENPQDLLLRLLNHPKPSQTDNLSSRASAAAFSPPVVTRLPETAVDDVAQDLADAKLEDVPVNPSGKAHSASPMRIFGSDGTGQSSHFQPETTAPPPTKFTYVNPFDKLEAASPRNRTPAPESSTAPAAKMEILKPKHGLDGSSASGEGRDQPNQKMRKLSPSQSTDPRETVAEAVSELAEQVGQQVGEALAEAEIRSEAQAATELERISSEDIKEMEEAIVDTAVEIKKELEDESNVKAMNESVPKPLTDALKEVATEIAQADTTDVADSWESAEAEDSPAKDEDQTVIVYRFPMRAFASITVKDLRPQSTLFPPELFMDVVRLKKEFDQIDRSLVSATKNFIVYAIVKKGGFRIIRQESGNWKQVFENHQERLFNVAMCTGGEDSSQPSVESIVGIGINGSVFWTSVDPSREDEWGENLDAKGLKLPPSPSQDDNTSGGQLKTRAKPSSCHPEYFAVGRGRAIHIIWPQVAAQYVRSKSRIVHTEKYLKERSLKIVTGKAGKDFTFSGDDTVIVSLDKAGRMRFWDIRSLTNPDIALAQIPEQVEVSETLLEFHTTSPNAKSWPTSVFFFDKDRQFKTGIALRYVMVGMKQNHTFQLWDLGLCKAVQEINLPHEKESDAICSVAFHPRTGIMAVAHPTRNSIFFVHVSCPRYNLPAMSQATYISRIAKKNGDKLGPTPALPPVNATAIMTSMAEYSFASKGQIRSLHMLNEPVPAGTSELEDAENPALFELYVMHSKGVCTLRIRRSDLGWKKEGEPIRPKEAEEEGVISISQLKPPQPIAESEPSTSGDTPGPKSTSDKSARESIKKESSNVSRQSMTPEAAMRASTLAKVESKQDAARAAIINGGEKSEKKKKKRATTDTASQASTSIRAPPPSYAQAAQATPRSKSPAQPVVAPEPTPSVSKTSDTVAPDWAKKLVSQLQQPAPPTVPELDTKKLEEIVQAEISAGFSRELDVMYKRIEEDKRIAKAKSGAEQDAMLRMVSTTLNENVEGVIRKMVDENMREVLLPALEKQTASALEKSIGGNLKSALAPHVSNQIPEAVSRALKNPQTFQPLSEQVAKKLSGNLELMIVAAVGSVVNPAVSNLSNLVEHKIGDQLRQAQAQHHNDMGKISQLTDTVQTCLQTIQAMAASQGELQHQVNKLQQHLSQVSVSSPKPSASRGSPRVTRSPVKQKSPEQVEAEEIYRLMAEGNCEQGTMRWLQSTHSNELFDTVFVRCNPAYLSQVTPLVALSTGAVVTDTLEKNLQERLIWLDTVLKNIDPNHAEIHDVIPKIMEVINQRLTAAYIRLNESSPGDPLLRRISGLVTKVNELSRAVVPYGPHA